MADPNAGKGLKAAAKWRWEHGGKQAAEEKAKREEQERRAKVASGFHAVHMAALKKEGTA